LFELSFRNTISEKENTFGGLIGLLFLKIGPVIDEFGDHVLQDKSGKWHDDGNSAGAVTLVIGFRSSTISTRDS
jgi:hypothetical protein